MSESDCESDEDVFGNDSTDTSDQRCRVGVKREYQHCQFGDAALITSKIKLEPTDQLKTEHTDVMPALAPRVPQDDLQRIKEEPQSSQLANSTYHESDSHSVHSDSQAPDWHVKAEHVHQEFSYSSSQMSTIPSESPQGAEMIDTSACFGLETRLLAVDQLAEENPLAAELLRIEMQLAADLLKINYSSKVSHVYNPVDYAYKPHLQYYRRFCMQSAKVLMIGINPGPNGMSQTGVPFGEVKAVSQWLKICEEVGSPSKQHVKKPVVGFGCRISEPSGTRIWNLIRSQFDSPEEFFKRCFIYNYCPLSLMEPSGKNFTPAQLPAAPRRRLMELCDQALISSISLFPNCHTLIGVGRFAEERIKEVCRLTGLSHKQSYLLHPSPLNRKAHNNWTPNARRVLEETGILPPSAESSPAPSAVKADVDLVKRELFHPG